MEIIKTKTPGAFPALFSLTLTFTAAKQPIDKKEIYN